jgi:hypothetical protein
MAASTPGGSGTLGGVQWSPRPASTALRVGAALVFGLATAFLVEDIVGRVMLGAVALGLAVDAAHDLLARPRLAAGPDGVVVHTWAGRQQLPWAGLRARVRTTTRFGLVTRTLEIDTDPAVDDDGVLVVLDRRDVGAPLDEVARRLRAWNPTTDPRGRPDGFPRG